MNPKVLLLLIPLLLGGIAFWLVQADDEPMLPGKTETTAVASDPGSASSARAQATEATSQGGDSEAVRAAVGAMTGQPVPFPDDAVWIEVRVVDKATSEPVAEALVTWSDQTTNERIGKDQSLTQEDRNWLRRDHEKSNLRYGWQTISDAKGVARVHLSDNTLVVARREGRYGKLNLQKNTIPPRDGYRVELEPDIEVLVQVLDAHGTPAAGIPISVTQYDAKGNPVQMWRWEPIAITHAPDGIAALRHLQEWRAEMGQAANSVAEWRVRTSLPGYEDPGAPFAIEPATEPVVLRLPPCGGVRVRAELHGEALTVIKTIGLREKRDGNARGGEMRNWMMQRVFRSCPTDAQGWAHFEHVPLGATFHASANAMSGYLGKEFKGPMTQDQSVTVLLTVGDDQILLTGRLLDEQKAVLADREFTLNVRGQHNDSGSTFRSDAQGRFLVLLGAIDKERPRPLQRVSIVWREPPALLQADLTNRDYRAGLQDAGDVVLQPGKLVVAGRLVTGEQPCKLPVQPMIERHEVVEGRPEPRWRSQRDFQYVKAEEGHFEYRGEAAPGRYRLRFDSNHHLPVEPIEFAIGTKDLVVRIDAGAPLAASVLLPKDSPEGLRAVLVADGTPAVVVEPLNWRQGSDRHTTQPWAQPDGRYQLQWRSIAPGTYTLQLQLWGEKEPLASIAGVQVPGPEGGDGRLVDIDLRSLLRVATVRLFDQNGQALDSYDGALFPFGQDPEKMWLGYDVQGSATRLLLRTQPLELLVCRRGFRPLQIHCAGETTEARLDPWPTVEIVFDGLPELPKETTLFAQLAPRDVREAKYRSLWNDGDRSELMTVPGRGIKVAEGRARVPIGDGPHDVKLSVGGKRRSIDIDLPRRDPVLPNAQSLRVDLSAASLQQAIDKVNAPADGK